jgi:glucoamylase
MAAETASTDAPGGPGIRPAWTSSAKDMVTTALGSSRIWATIGYGIVNEVYWPSTGEPQLRDLGFIVKGPKGWTEVKRARRYLVTTPSAHVPLPHVVHEGDDYRLELEFLVHPLRDGLLVRYRLDGEGNQLHVLVAPHLGGDRADNYAWAGADLAAQRGTRALCVRASGGFRRTSAGYVGASDGWQDFARHGEMTWSYDRASSGNVALTGALAANAGTLALCFSTSVDGARTLARTSLADDYDTTRALFVSGWENWGRGLELPPAPPELRRAAELSAAVLKVHEDRTYNGAVVASLSVPWGQSHDDPGGYHLVWTRDAVEAALALLAVGKTDDVLRILAYLIGTQAEDGSWAQNYYPSGSGYWQGNQLDEVALPALLAAKLMAAGALSVSEPVSDMIRRAVAYLVRHGPMTDQDRWEENAGASPFTLSFTLAAMVGLAAFFGADERDYLLALADCWNERIESWTYVAGGPLSAAHGIPGYYARLGPPPAAGGLAGMVPIRNRADGETPAAQIVGLEFLHLVRTGLRRPDDPRIVATLKLADALLRVETPSGPCYRRYNGDGYGEHADGSAYDGTGIGRLWPLLVGERGHYDLMAGGSAWPWLDAMERMTGPGGLIPEQIWDADPIPERGLVPGKPSGSAMPLVWAHAEFLKLLAAAGSRRPVELLDAVLARWGREAPTAGTWFWRDASRFAEAPAGRRLVIEHGAPFQLLVTRDGQSGPVRASAPAPFGLHGVAIAAAELAGVARLAFTLTPEDGDAVSGSIAFRA